jgi:hypothetical protein
VTDVAEKVGLGAIEGGELVVGVTEFLVRGIELLTPAQDFELHDLRLPLEDFVALAFLLAPAAHADELGDVFYAVNDVQQLAGG